MSFWACGASLQSRITDDGETDWNVTANTPLAVAVYRNETSVFGHGVAFSISYRARDADGAQLWSGNHAATVQAVAFDPSGNIYIGGEVNPDGYNYRKLDADGDQIFEDNTTGTCYAISARGSDFAYVSSGGYLYQRDADSTSWITNWNYNHGAVIYALAEDANGNIYLGGVRSSNVSVRKIDEDGQLVWSFDTGGNIRALAIDHSSGHLYAVGVRVGTATAWKLDLDGNEVTTGWPTDHGAELLAAVVDGEGNVCVGGVRISDISTRKYQANGTEITTGEWPLNQSAAVFGLAYLELLQTAAPALALPVSLGSVISTFSHRAESGLSLPVALALPTPSAPPVPPAPDPTLRTVYRLYLSAAGGSDLLELPLAGLEARQRADGGSTWLAVTVPSAAEALTDAIAARLGGEVVIYAGVATPSGETVGEFLRATFTESSIERGPRAGSVTLTARVIPTAFTAGSYALSLVAERGASGGRRFAVCAVDPRIRPNDTVNDGLASWTAGIIFYRIDPVTASMRVTETL